MNENFTTEQSSKYNDLEKMSVEELLVNINREDRSVAETIEKQIPQIKRVIDAAVLKLKTGGRLFYLGAGTSGRLGIVDASECPPTFGVDHGVVIGIIAGGDHAIRKAVEFAEDDSEQGWKDLLSYDISANDFVIGIAASGGTPYVVGALSHCQNSGIPTACITCNTNSPLAAKSDFPIEVIVGPEFITGSTRMKAGTAQKLVLNMISSACMIQIGKVRGNKMVDMQLSNNKLVKRGTIMIADALKIEEKEALSLLEKHGSVRKAIDEYKKG